jgi:hypothetical protein
MLVKRRAARAMSVLKATLWAVEGSRSESTVSTLLRK